MLVIHVLQLLVLSYSTLFLCQLGYIVCVIYTQLQSLLHMRPGFVIAVIY